MGYKKMKEAFGFADMAVAHYASKNRSVQKLEALRNAIYWPKIEKSSIGIIKWVNQKKEPKHIHPLSCSNVCCFNSGTV